MKTFLWIIAVMLIVNTLLFIIFRFWFFFRDPKRIVPDRNNIVSPADGIVIYIHKIDNGEIPFSLKNGVRFNLQDICPEELPNFRYIIGIYMTEVNVHINRTPIAGTIRGSYSVECPNQSMMGIMLNWIFKLKPYEQDCTFLGDNTRRITLIEGDFPVGVVQIADKWINRIDFYNNIGDTVKKGDKIGMIRMGSQCDLLLPEISGLSIKVSEGDKVKAGSHIIAEYGDNT